MILKEIVDSYLIENFQSIEDWRTGKKEGFQWEFVLHAIDVFGKEENSYLFKIGRGAKSKYHGYYFTMVDYVRKRFRVLRELKNKQGNVTFDKFNTPILHGLPYTLENNNSSATQDKFVYTQKKEDTDLAKGKSEKTVVTSREIKTLEDLIEVCEIDTEIWNIDKYVQNSWGNPNNQQWQVKAFLSVKQEKLNLTKSFDKFISEYNKVIFVNQTQSQFNKKEEERNIPNDVLYLVSLSDLHIGNYQKAGYLDRVRQRVFETFKSIAGSGVKKVILLNTGDMLHTNGSQGTTLGGTQLDSELSFEDSFTQGLDLITSIIDYAATLSLSVTYVNVRGNHSFDTEYCLGEALKKIYQKQQNIEILNQRDTRIYYLWNNNAFMFTHGDKAVERLPLLFATEGKEFFNKAENHHILLGHTHHNSSKQFVNDRKEYAGIEVRVLGSPTSNDQWHKENGFTGNKKSIVSMLFTPEEGKYAEFNFKLFK